MQSLFHAARHGCAGIGGQGLGCWLDDVVNRDESSSGCTDGLGMHPGHAPCAQQGNADHDLPPFKMSTFTSGGRLIGKGGLWGDHTKRKIKYVWSPQGSFDPKKTLQNPITARLTEPGTRDPTALWRRFRLFHGRALYSRPRGEMNFVREPSRFLDTLTLFFVHLLSEPQRGRPSGIEGTRRLRLDAGDIAPFP
jgi:hypothetical protein